MIVKFPGTRGAIEEISPAHRYHSSLLISCMSTKVLIDFGVEHGEGLLKEAGKCDAILITHAHPDHYIWTVADEKNIKTPVYLTQVALDYGKYRPRDYRIIKAYERIPVKDLNFTAYPVMHSIRCPAVGFRVEADKIVVYAPDILDFVEDKAVVLKNADCLIADGSSIDANLTRRRNGILLGHTRVKTVAGWCKKYGVKKLIVTHCGKQIVTMDAGELEEKIDSYREEFELEIMVAHDGMIEEI
ncbi:MAG: MBL fold metallo-hydrolase [Actinobacteria bacterium]|nr:MBL fold metallo-hydrolase [Actinomycetota bacterium]